MLSDPRPVVICYYFHYLPGNWVWLQFLCAVKISGDLPLDEGMIANKILIVLVFWWSSRLGYLDEAIRDLETVEEVGLCPPARLHLLLGKLVAKLSLATNLFFFRWSCSAIEGEKQKRARFRLFHLIFGSVYGSCLAYRLHNGSEESWKRCQR